MAIGYLAKEQRSNLHEELQRAVLNQVPVAVDIKPHQQQKTQQNLNTPNCSLRPPKICLVSGLPVSLPVSSNRQRVARQRSSSSLDHDNIIRTRFLGRLGIHKQDRLQGQAVAAATQASSSSSSCNLRRKSFCETLKGDYGTPDATLQLGCSFSSVSTTSTAPCSLDGDTSTASTTTLTSSRNVSFGTTVVVHSIPSRSAYSDRVRNSYWTSSNEMRENAARNCFEFAAESWDWRQVTEEQDMVLYQGERVHPVHFVHQFSLRQHFTPTVTIRSSFV